MSSPCGSLILRGVAQLGSAPLWGSGGRGFKSRRSDLKLKFMFPEDSVTEGA